MNDEIRWIEDNWEQAVSLLGEASPEYAPFVSKVPTMVLPDRFVLFFALNLDEGLSKEYWILTGNLPPAIVDAENTEDERGAVDLFAKLYLHDGNCLKSDKQHEMLLPKSVVSHLKNNKDSADSLLSIGAYLQEMEKSFPWNDFGLNGKVFSME